MSLFSSEQISPRINSSYDTLLEVQRVSRLLNLIPLKIRNACINKKTLEEIGSIISKQETPASSERQISVANFIERLEAQFISREPT